MRSANSLKAPKLRRIEPSPHKELEELDRNHGGLVFSVVALLQLYVSHLTHFLE